MVVILLDGKHGGFNGHGGDATLNGREWMEARRYCSLMVKIKNLLENNFLIMNLLKRKSNKFITRSNPLSVRRTKLLLQTTVCDWILHDKLIELN